MRNPLHFSSALLVKKAMTQPPILNIPAFSPATAPGPVMSDDQITGLLQNIKSYPEEQQQKMLDSINKDYDNSSYRGGLFGRIGGNIGNWGSSLGNSLQQGANWVSEGLFGAKPFDAQDSDRYRAETVLRSAAKNPEMYKRVTERLNATTAPAATAAQPAATPPAAQPTTTPSATPATPTPAAQPAPTPKFDINQLTTVAPALRGPLRPQAPAPAAVTPTPTPTPTPAAQPAPAPAPVTPTPPAAQPAVPTPTPAAPTPAVMENSLASAASGSVLNKPVAPAAQAPAPRKEGLIEGKPAGQWIAENKARQEQDAKNFTGPAVANPNNPSVQAASGMVYNATTGQMVPRGYNPYTGNVPSAQRQLATNPALVSATKPTTPTQPTALTPEQQKNLDKYNRSPAGRWQNMSKQRLNAGIEADNRFLYPNRR